jgi:hypothetical protein
MSFYSWSSLINPLVAIFLLEQEKKIIAFSLDPN